MSHNGSPVAISNKDKTTQMRAIKQLLEAYDRYANNYPDNKNAIFRKTSIRSAVFYTFNGLYLEYHRRQPRRLWTPWGCWLFGGAQLSATDVTHFDSHLKLKVFVPHERPGITIDVVKAIMRVGNTQLPRPDLATKDRSPEDDELARVEWVKLCAIHGLTAT